MPSDRNRRNKASALCPQRCILGAGSLDNRDARKRMGRVGALAMMHGAVGTPLLISSDSESVTFIESCGKDKVYACRSLVYAWKFRIGYLQSRTNRMARKEKRARRHSLMP